MHNISREFIVRWSETEAGSLPATVDTICPHCGFPMAFVLADWSHAADVNTRFAKSRCVNCNHASNFFWIGDEPETRGGAEDGFGLYIHPTPGMTRRPVEGVEDAKDFEMALRRAYASAINMYNAREWTGTVVVVRRTLEDIAKGLVPPDVQKLQLSKQIEAIRKSRDFSEPVAMLAGTMRLSGNLGPYIELEKEPDREVAMLMLDILGYLVQYVYALPARIKKLNQSIEQLAQKEPAKTVTVR